MSEQIEEPGVTPGDGTVAAMVRWLQWTIDTHELVDSTASALRTGCLKVMEVIPDTNVAIGSVDIEDVVRKFRIKHRGGMKDATVNTYEQRFRQTVDMYSKWLAEDDSWRPATRNRTTTKKEKAPAAPKTPQQKVNKVPEHKNQVQSGTITYPFPIRPGIQGQITLPEDLTVREAKRIAAFVATLAFDDEPVTEPLRAITGSHFHENDE